MKRIFFGLWSVPVVGFPGASMYHNFKLCPLGALNSLKNISIETLLPFQPKGRKSNKAHFSEASSRKNELHLFSLIFNLNFINFF